MLNEVRLEQISQKAKSYMLYASLSNKVLLILLLCFIVYGFLIGLGFIQFNLLTGLCLATAYVVVFGFTHYLNHCVGKLLLKQEQILFG